MDRLYVFKETHSTGEPHFHAVVRLINPMRFASAKKTLQERHMLPSHWSVSHTQMWSAVRYCVLPSAKKPEVDKTPYVCSTAGPVDLFAESQEPYQASSWKRKREESDLTLVYLSTAHA